MNSLNALAYTCPCSASSSSSTSSYCPSSFHRFFTRKRRHYRAPQVSFSTPKRRRARASRINPDRTKSSGGYNKEGSIISISSTYGDAGDQNLRLVLNVDEISTLASSQFHRFLDFGREACSDLQNLITVDENRRVVVSCRRTTLQFVGSLVLLGFVLVVAVRVLVGLGSAFRRQFEPKPKVLVRRDRSLGGKEVIVAVDTSTGQSRGSENSVSSSRVSGTYQGAFRPRVQQKLPKWWPLSVASQSWVTDKEEYQREANRLVRVIMDNRTSGKDIMEDDIIQLRRLCRTAGVRVSIDPINTRDSIYRTSVDFVLKACCRAPWESTSVQIDGEDARDFVAGLAENLGLENARAARMVSAAVAARTRSWFLQAWALEMQDNHSEVILELSRICLVHRIFPPEESSAEMEMVARGLEKLMNVEERKLLFKNFVRICGEGGHRSAAEALGLLQLSPEPIGD